MGSKFQSTAVKIVGVLFAEVVYQHSNSTNYRAYLILADGKRVIIEMRDWDELLYQIDTMIENYKINYPLPTITYDSNFNKTISR